MKKITPYSNVNEATKSLDNGGRFYNILTEANDGVITKEEVGKVAGLFSNKQQMVLFFELSISRLNEKQKGEMIAQLETDFLSNYQIHKPQYLLPSEATQKGEIAANAIVTGIPKLTDSKSDFNGFIMIPIMAGSVMTFTMIPIIDQYDVYELRDNHSDKQFLIAHTKGAEKLPEKTIQVAGIIKELKAEQNQKASATKFLEIIYYSDHITENKKD